MRKLFYLLVFVLVAGLMAGCSGDSNGNDDSGGGNPPAAGNGGDNGNGNAPEPGLGSADLHEIAINWRIDDAINVLEPDLYGRMGSVKLSDTSGAAIVGATVRFALIDTIFAYGVDGEFFDSDNQFVSNARLSGSFTNAIVRDSVPMFLHDYLPGGHHGGPAWLMVRDSEFSDRARHISSVTGPNSLQVDGAFGESRSDRRYWVGINALAGVAVVSHEERTSLEAVTDENGYAQFEITYMPNGLTLGHGCGQYHADTGEYLGGDWTRQLILYAEAVGEPGKPHRAVAVDEAACLAAVEGGEVRLGDGARTDLVGPGPHYIRARILDGEGNPYPYAAVQADIEENAANLNIITSVDSYGYDRRDGWAQVMIEVTPGSPGDEVVVHIFGSDAEPEEITITL